MHALCERCHHVCVETGAGARIGVPDGDYRSAGARIVACANDVFAAEMVVKVKELQPAEFGLPRRGQIVFAYLLCTWRRTLSCSTHCWLAAPAESLMRR